MKKKFKHLTHHNLIEHNLKHTQKKKKKKKVRKICLAVLWIITVKL